MVIISNLISIIKWLSDAFGKFSLIAAASTYVRHVLNLCVSASWRTERRRQWCLVGFPTVPCCGHASSVSSHWWRPLTQTTPTCAATGRGQSLPPPHLWIQLPVFKGEITALLMPQWINVLPRRKSRLRVCQQSEGRGFTPQGHVTDINSEWW